MANGKLVQSEANVQRLLNDKDAMRKMVEDRIQELVEAEFEKHMGRKPYEITEELCADRIPNSALRLIGSIWQDIHEKWITGSVI
ncbi:MAG: hypothetical protein GQ565_06390 [Candidatus Aegiribacteria sp.]|nr:hypothetical protein [Candidatus Aegiribacteria sp.]